MIFPESEETQKGHMNEKRKLARSTKPKNSQADQLQDDNVETNLTPATQRKQKYVYSKIWDMKEKIYTDQTKISPVKSSRGHIYIMVMVEIDAK